MRRNFSECNQKQFDLKRERRFRFAIIFLIFLLISVISYLIFGRIHLGHRKMSSFS